MDKRPAKRSEKKPSKTYTPEQIKAFELAGGIEGGMPAGEAGGPGAGGTGPRVKAAPRRKGK
jgi:hypothetical protein